MPNCPLKKQQKEIRRLVNAMLRGWAGLPNPILSARNYGKKAQRLSEKQSGVIYDKNEILRQWFPIYGERAIQGK
jgi:hypothetical protein